MLRLWLFVESRPVEIRPFCGRIGAAPQLESARSGACEGSHHGIEEFLEMKYIMLGGIQV